MPQQELAAQAAGPASRASMSRQPSLVFLGLGSNLGNRVRNLALAAMRLSLLPGVELLRLSPVYESPPWGVTDQPAFLNMVLAARAAVDPHALLRQIKRLEAELGRVPSARWGARIIDIDILLVGDVRVRSPELTIPHPYLTQRQFALVPLADIAPHVLVAPGLSAASLADPLSPGLHRIGSLRVALGARTGESEASSTYAT